MRDDFSEQVKRTLAKRVNYFCSNPICRKLTSGPSHDENKSTLIGVAAHITAASKGGPRYDETLKSEERKSVQNGIWLCHNCSDMVDKDEKRFLVKTLKDWKKDTEKFIQQKISSNECYSQNIFNELMEIMIHLNSSKKISEILPKLFAVSIIHNLAELNELSSREINGWYSSELPKLNEENKPKYRFKQVYLSSGKVKFHVLSNITVNQVLENLGNQDKIFKLDYLFHEPIKEIELSIEKIPRTEEKLMSQKFPQGCLEIDGKLLEHESQIWYSSAGLISIESGLRQELNRKIIEIIKKTQPPF